MNQVNIKKTNSHLVLFKSHIICCKFDEKHNEALFLCIRKIKLQEKIQFNSTHNNIMRLKYHKNELILFIYFTFVYIILIYYVHPIKKSK